MSTRRATFEHASIMEASRAAALASHSAASLAAAAGVKDAARLLRSAEALARAAVAALSFSRASTRTRDARAAEPAAAPPAASPPPETEQAAKPRRRRRRRKQKLNEEAKEEAPEGEIDMEDDSWADEAAKPAASDDWGEGRWIPNPSVYPALMEKCKDADENAKLRHGFLSFIASPSASDLTGAQVLAALEAKVLSRALAGALSAGNQALSDSPVAAAEEIAVEQPVEKRARQ